MDEEINWLEYMGCCGWFNQQNGFFELVSHTKSAKVSGNDGPIWTLIGEKDEDILISVNMINTSACPKKYVHIIKPLLSVQNSGGQE